jgi:hypothetical protein
MEEVIRRLASGNAQQTLWESNETLRWLREPCFWWDWGRDGGRLNSKIGNGLVELEDKDLAVRMEGAAGGGLGFFHGIVGEEV